MMGIWFSTGETRMSLSPFFTLLTHEGLLAVRGNDAGKFLQGQLTCNINYLSDSHSSLGARCNVKGRMQSSFRIVSQSDGFLLAMDQQLLAGQLADLQKYAVFSKSRLSDESQAWVRIGLHQGEALLEQLGLLPGEQPGTVARQGERLAIRLDSTRCELWLPAGEQHAVLATLGEQLGEGPLQAWLLLQIRAGIGQVFAASRELFIPQMINLPAVDGVSFKKGCYTGQEIVARMQYLGKLKRRMYRLALRDAPLPAVACELFSPVHGSSVGEVVLAASVDGDTELLAVVQEDAVKDGRLHLGSPDGPDLHMLDLPYVVDADREIQR